MRWRRRMSSGGEPRSSVRTVVFVTANHTLPHDSRVWPEALAVRRWGCRVIGISPLGVRGLGTLPAERVEGIEIYRYPLRFADRGTLAYVREFGLAVWRSAQQLRRLGCRKEARYERIRGYMRIVTALLVEENVSLEGRWHRVRNLRLSPRLPIELVPGLLVSGYASPAFAAEAFEALVGRHRRVRRGVRRERNASATQSPSVSASSLRKPGMTRCERRVRVSGRMAANTSNPAPHRRRRTRRDTGRRGRVLDAGRKRRTCSYPPAVAKLGGHTSSGPMNMSGPP